MELRFLEPHTDSVRSSGIYIIGDDGISICADPFETEAAAIAAIEQRQERLQRDGMALSRAVFAWGER